MAKKLEEQQQELDAELEIRDSRCDLQRKKEKKNTLERKKNTAKNSKTIAVKRRGRRFFSLNNNTDWKKSNATSVRKRKSVAFVEKKKSAFTLPMNKMNGR